MKLIAPSFLFGVLSGLLLAVTFKQRHAWTSSTADSSATSQGVPPATFFLKDGTPVSFKQEQLRVIRSTRFVMDPASHSVDLIDFRYKPDLELKQ